MLRYDKTYKSDIFCVHDTNKLLYIIQYQYKATNYRTIYSSITDIYSITQLRNTIFGTYNTIFHAISRMTHTLNVRISVTRLLRYFNKIESTSHRHQMLLFQYRQSGETRKQSIFATQRMKSYTTLDDLAAGHAADRHKQSGSPEPDVDASAAE